MFDFMKKNVKNKELDVVIQKLQMNMENNYKDAAQINLKELEALLSELTNSGKLNDRQKSYYEEQLTSFRERMKNFTHRDQKPTWV